MRIYVASRASIPERSAMWRQLRADGVNIVSSWIDEAGSGETANLSEHWQNICKEIISSERLILYVQETDFPLKGAFVEVGIALGHSIPVCVVTPDCNFSTPSYRPIGSWITHPLVRVMRNMQQALREELPTKEQIAVSLRDHQRAHR